MKTADDIADDVVAIFGAVVDPPIQFTARNPATVDEIFAEAAGFQVFVVPEDEAEEPFTQGGDDGVKETITLSIVVAGPIGDGVTRKLALSLAKTLRLALRDTEFDGYAWDGNQSLVLFDNDALDTKSIFLALFLSTYWNIT